MKILIKNGILIIDGYKRIDNGAEWFYDYITNSDGALAGYEGEPSENSGVRSSDNFFSKGIYNRWSFYYRWDVNGNGTDGSDDWDLLGSWDSSSSFPESSKSDGGYGSRSVPSNVLGCNLDIAAAMGK